MRQQRHGRQLPLVIQGEKAVPTVRTAETTGETVSLGGRLASARRADGALGLVSWLHTADIDGSALGNWLAPRLQSSGPESPWDALRATALPHGRLLHYGLAWLSPPASWVLSGFSLIIPPFQVAQKNELHPLYLSLLCSTRLSGILHSK